MIDEQPPQKFYARVWLHWATFLILLFLGLNSTIIGVLFWTGSMRDANNQLRPETGPPATIVGSLFLMGAINSFFNLWQRFKPTIQCYRDGIECRVSTANALDRFRYLPRVVRALWMAISLPALRYKRIWVEWKNFYSAQVDGRPMEYFLLLYGDWQTRSQQAFADCAVIAQVDLKLNPHEVARAINQYARDAELRNSVLEMKNR